MTGRRRPGRAVQRADANRAWWVDLWIFLGSLILGPPLGILLEGAIRQADPGPLTAALLVWGGLLTVLWRYWRRDPRPPMFRTRDLYEFRENHFYFVTHLLVIMIPVGVALLIIAARPTGG